MKKTAAFFAFIIIMMIITTQNAYASDAIEVVLDGEKIEFNMPSFTENGVTFVPAEDILKSLGVSYEINKDEGILSVEKNDKSIIMIDKQLTAEVDGSERTISAGLQVRTGTFYVPLRFICETFGARVYWNKDLARIIIYSGEQNVCRVERVIDKCTLIVDFNGEKKLVVPMGIEGADSIFADPNEDFDLSAVAFQFADDMLTGRDVYIEFDVNKTDRLGRLKAYIFSEGNFYNAELVKNGYAAAEIVRPNIKYADLLASCQKEAMTESLGLWEDQQLKNKYWVRLLNLKVDGHVKLCLDPGHGGPDGGAAANGYVEKDINLPLAILLKYKLERCGFEVVLTRDSDSYMSLEERADVGLKNQCDAIISCHFNAYNGEAHGFEAIYTFNDEFAWWIGDCVYQEAVKLGMYRRGVWTRESESYPGKSWYGILRNSEPMPGVILEGLFIDNDEDIKILEQPGFLNELASVYCKGICSAYGIEYIE